MWKARQDPTEGFWTECPPLTLEAQGRVSITLFGSVVNLFRRRCPRTGIRGPAAFKAAASPPSLWETTENHPGQQGCCPGMTFPSFPGAQTVALNHENVIMIWGAEEGRVHPAVSLSHNAQAAQVCFLPGF